MNDIVVALDQIGRHKALELAQAMSGKVWGFKVNDLLIECGVSIISELKRYGNVFADPKLHDIPNTVYNCVDHIALAGADMVTVHVSGGVPMMTAAKNAASRNAKKGKQAKIIGVTMLTSLSPNNLRSIYRGYPLERLCELANEGNVDGIVCAGQELPFWNLFTNLIKVVPGFRPNGPMTAEDQTRLTTSVNTDFIVIGRPIVQAENPLAALEEVRRSLGRTD